MDHGCFKCFSVVFFAATPWSIPMLVEIRSSNGQLERRHQLDPTQDMNGYEGYLEFHGLCVGLNPQQVTWNFAVVQLRPCFRSTIALTVTPKNSCLPLKLGTPQGHCRFQFANKKDGSYFIDVPEASANLWKQLQIW